MEVQPGLVRLDLVSCEIALAPHGPYRRYDLGVIRNFMLFLEGPVVGIHVSVDFLDKTACTNSFASDCLIACWRYMISPIILAWNVIGFLIRSCSSRWVS